jgi:hypothetical protein
MESTNLKGRRQQNSKIDLLHQTDDVVQKLAVAFITIGTKGSGFSSQLAKRRSYRRLTDA